MFVLIKTKDFIIVIGALHKVNLDQLYIANFLNPIDLNPFLPKPEPPPSLLV